MPGKRINHRLVKQHRNYTVDETARLLGVHENTVRGWIAKRLPVIDDCKPILILGWDLKDWLAEKTQIGKTPMRTRRVLLPQMQSAKAPSLGNGRLCPQN